MSKKKRNLGPKPGGRRQAKLAARAAEREALTVDPRSFRGLAAECDLVAMREFVPSATFAATTTDGVELTIATVLPGAVAAQVRDDASGGGRFVGVQTVVRGPRPGIDLGNAARWVADAAPGSTLESAVDDGNGVELRDVIVADADYEVRVYEDFSWWEIPGADENPQIKQAIDAANEAMMPSARIEADGVEAAWWVDAGEKAHIRWVRPEDEDALFAALARVHAAGGLTLGDGSRFAGSFRTHGLLVPVFDLDPEAHPREWADGCVELGRRLDEALAVDTPLTSDERRSRDGLRSRQVTLRG